MIKFNIGDEVTITGGSSAGRGGVIVDIGNIEFITNGLYERKYWVEERGYDNGKRIYPREGLLEKVAANVFEESVSANTFMESHPELYQERKPRFEIGDVVEDTDTSYIVHKGHYFIKEAVFVDNGDKPSEYLYEAALIDSPDESEIFHEYALTYQYHDDNWEKYITESVGNGLPAWRGDLYNLYELYVNPNKPDIGFTNVADDYYNDTIPPIYMKHILDRHTIYGRIGAVLGSIDKPGENKNIIMSRLKFNKEKINAVRNSIEEKIMKRNRVGYTEDDNVHFTSDEIRLAEQIDLLDIESTKNGGQHYVDHFKLELRNIDIMKMIQQAYKSARKVENRVIDQTSKDLRTGYVDFQNLGKVDYEGVSRDGTVIRFTYDFDVNVIDTAYPLRMNNNVKKHKDSDEKFKEKLIMERKEEIEKLNNMSKFKIGQRVDILRGRGKGCSGVIKAIQKTDMQDTQFEYEIRLDGEKENRIYYEYNLEQKINGSDYFNERAAKEDAKEPKFKVGDIVEDTRNVGQSLSYPVYIIKESITLFDGDMQTGYSYEAAPINSPDESIIINEEGLSYQYHDSNWEVYFQILTEGTRQRKLPKWRGELYNLYACYIDVDTHGALDRATIREYEDHTIPPLRMEHILNGHSIYSRIWDVVLHSGNARYRNNREEIKRNLKIDDLELDEIADSVRRKINARNKNDLNSKNMKIANKAHPDFTEKEYQFIYEIDRLDISKGILKDHFPAYMTNLQIMDAIKEVYESRDLKRIDGKQICSNKKEGAEEDLDAPQLGKVHYQGYSSRHDLYIEFLYNFDYNFIETAYPLRMNNNVKKH